MNVYEMPECGSASESVVEAEMGTEAEISLEEQVRRTSESVERLANIFAQAVQAFSSIEIDRSKDADA